jgi:Mechanosensitive ion channel, conserved TM helix
MKMDNTIQGPFFDFGKQIIDYLPNLLAGILLLGLGWLVGWLIKRIIIQLLVALKFDRLFTRMKWRRALSKADVRYALFGFVGNVFFFIVFLIFLNSALDAMKLTVLSNLIQRGVLFIPKLIIALIIFGFGWIVAGRVSNSVHIALIKEDVPNYSLIARFTKFVIILFFSAMALAEIDIAVEIVIIGFTTIIISLAILAILITIIKGRTSLNEFIKNSR